MRGRLNFFGAIAVRPVLSLWGDDFPPVSFRLQPSQLHLFMRIALDAMGGDFAPGHIVEGAVLALREYDQLSKLFLVGDQARIAQELSRLGYQDPRIEIVHSTQVVDMSDGATNSVRSKRDSSRNPRSPPFAALSACSENSFASCAKSAFCRRV